jgi:3-hydroxybutyryl-CoA dehydratase
MTEASRTTLPNELHTATLASNAAMARQYAELTADFNPIHLDPEFAAKTPFQAPIVHGTMSFNLLMRAIEDTFGGVMPAADIDARFIKPVSVGATIRAGGVLVDAATGTYQVFVETDAGQRAVEGTLSLHAFKKHQEGRITA